MYTVLTQVNSMPDLYHTIAFFIPNYKDSIKSSSTVDIGHNISVL